MNEIFIKIKNSFFAVRNGFMVLRERLRPGNVRVLYFRYEAYFSPLVLLFGFIVDNLTLRRVDLWAENLVIITYLSLALLSILFLSAYEAGRFKKEFLIKAAKFAPFVLQFTFGGLFSAFFVFYNRSAELSASWPFLLVIVSFLAGNETFRQRYQLLAFRLSVFFMALFSYAVFAVPILTARIGWGTFLLSGLAAVILISLVIWMVRKIAPAALARSRLALGISLAGIYLAFNIFYFFNLIPPIPLAVKESGIYHSLSRQGNSYTVAYEPSEWYVFWREYSDVFRHAPGGRAYHYTAVFAPTEFNVRVLHHWQYYNEAEEEWQSISRLGFPIKGGRDGGYRGYSYKKNIWPGKWRVDTITEQGQVMGRTFFTIVRAQEAPELEQGVK